MAAPPHPKPEAHRPDVTLMDLQMPNVNRIEAISRIKSEFPDGKVLMLSTYTGDVQVLRRSRRARGVTC
jgi:DNA-binding NarL/FixJ family response regulator